MEPEGASKAIQPNLKARIEIQAFWAVGGLSSPGMPPELEFSPPVLSLSCCPKVLKTKRPDVYGVGFPSWWVLTLIIIMQLTIESAWTQTKGSDLTPRAQSSHLRSSASLMQHHRTRLLERELPGWGWIREMGVRGAEGGHTAPPTEQAALPEALSPPHLHAPGPAGERCSPGRAHGQCPLPLPEAASGESHPGRAGSFL